MRAAAPFFGLCAAFALASCEAPADAATVRSGAEAAPPRVEFPTSAVHEVPSAAGPYKSG